VYERMVDAAQALVAGTYPLIVAGTAPRRPQDHRAATTFGRRDLEDGRIRWGWPAPRIHNLVRAVTHPYPGAFADWRGSPLFVWETRVAESEGNHGPPGTILNVTDDGFVVQTGSGRLLVRSVQREGGPEVTGSCFLAQERLGVGDSIGV